MLAWVGKFPGPPPSDELAESVVTHEILPQLVQPVWRALEEFPKP